MVGRIPTVKEPLLEGGRLFWLEQRPHEKGRTTLLVKPAPAPSCVPNLQPLELTPGDWNLRSRIHEYG